MLKYLFAFAALAQFMFARAQEKEIKLQSRGYIDVAYIYNDPSGYFKYPKEKTFNLNPFNVQTNGGNAIRDDENGLRNLSSAGITFKAFNLVGDLVIHSSFLYSLNKEWLYTATGGISYSQISKYKDLARRYNAIRPVSVDLVLGMGLNPEDKYTFGVYGFFRVTNNDLIITAQEKAPYSTPSSYTWGEVLRVDGRDDATNLAFIKPEGFSATNKDRDALAKILGKTDRVASFSWSKMYSDVGAVRKNAPIGNAYVKIIWPEEQINEIGELYSRYETGKEKPPSEEVEEALAKKNMDPYGKNDEWSEAFEDDLKGVEAFVDYDNKILGLKNDKRVIRTFDWSAYSGISKIGNSAFFKLDNRNGRASGIVDKRGNKQKVNGYETFSLITTESNGFLKLEVDLTPPDFVAETELGLGLVNDNEFYQSAAQASGLIRSRLAEKTRIAEEERKEAERAYNERIAAGGRSEVYLSLGPMISRYHTVNIKRMTTDEQLKVVTTKQGYLIRTL